jgi:hypothetical protein
MARIRTIKPSFFRSEDVSTLPLRARLTWIGLWTQCDDAGRAKDNARLIKGDIWPLDDVSLRDIEDDLETLAARGRIVRYVVDGRRYLAITNWRDHQTIQKPSESKIPAPPPDSYQPPTAPLPEPDDTATSGKGREGKGREGTRASAREIPPPSPKCPQHADDPDPPPCGPCADARKARERWDRDQARAVSEAQSLAARRKAEAARAEIDACRMCDATGYRDGTLCSHDPDSARRAANGAAAARKAIRA